MVIGNTQAYFKVEQEAAVQERRQKLMQDGKLRQEEERKQLPSSEETIDNDNFAESQKLYDVNPEILQAQARIDDPHAFRRRRFDEIRNVKARPEPPSQEDIQKARLAGSAGFGFGFSHVPKMSLAGRNRFAVAEVDSSAGAAMTALQHVSSESIEISKRGYATGMRALAWGSFLGFSLLALGGLATVKWMVNIGDAGGLEVEGDFKTRVAAAMAPRREEFRSWIRHKLAYWIEDGRSLSASNPLSRSAFDGAAVEHSREK